MKFSVTCVQETIIVVGVEADSQEEAEEKAANGVGFLDYSCETYFKGKQITDEEFAELSTV